MIQVDLTHMRRFIALPYEAALAPRLRIAHNHLQKGDGARRRLHRLGAPAPGV